MSMLKPGTCRKYMIDVPWIYKHINPNIVGVHKCLVSNSIDICLKSKNLKPVTFDLFCKQYSVKRIILYILNILIPHFKPHKPN